MDLKGRKEHKTEKKMYNEALNDIYSPINIIQVIKSRKKGCMGCVVNMGEEKTGFWCGKLKERDHMKYFHVDGKSKMILLHPGVAQRVGRGIALIFHDPCTRRG